MKNKERRTPIRRSQWRVDEAEPMRFSTGYPLAWAIRRSPCLVTGQHFQGHLKSVLPTAARMR